jgi:hypothetical protein
MITELFADLPTHFSRANWMLKELFGNLPPRKARNIATTLCGSMLATTTLMWLGPSLWPTETNPEPLFPLMVFFFGWGWAFLVRRQRRELVEMAQKLSRNQFETELHTLENDWVLRLTTPIVWLFGLVWAGTMGLMLIVALKS